MNSNEYIKEIRELCEQLILELITRPNLQYKYNSNSKSIIYNRIRNKNNEAPVTLWNIIDYMTEFIYEWRMNTILYNKYKTYDRIYKQNKIKEFRNLIPIFKSMPYTEYENIIGPILKYIDSE